MAIIQAHGLFNGRRLLACSDMARLLWPYLFLASNGYGRLEIDYDMICRTYFANFRKFPKSSEFFGILREYQENGLLFLYETADGGVWGQWDAQDGTLPRFKTQKDRQSPSPDETQFSLWKKQSLLQTKPLPKISEILRKFPLGEERSRRGVGEEKIYVSPNFPSENPGKRFTAPTPAEVRDYGLSIGFEIDGEKFCDFYAAKGWVVGKSPMKDWRAAVRTWRAQSHTAPVNGPVQRPFRYPMPGPEDEEDYVPH